MFEDIIVGIVILAAAAFTVYRLFFRPSCGCGQDCGCGSSCASRRFCGAVSLPGNGQDRRASAHGERATGSGGCCCGR